MIKQINSWIEISKQNLLFNINNLRKITKDAYLMAVIKSNAYGHGMKEVAEIIKNKVDWFGVVNLAEALQLRKAGYKNKILVLSYYFFDQDDIKEGIRKNIDFVVYRDEQIRYLGRQAKALNKKVNAHIKIDTGTSRIGFLPADSKRIAKLINRERFLVPYGLMSHFASAEDDPKGTDKQLKIFEETEKFYQQQGINFKYRHISCSASAILGKKYQKNLSRIGIALYGLWPSFYIKERYNNLQLRPVLSWKTKLIQIKEIDKGTRVGYGGTFKADKKMRIGIIPVGYYEGYRRDFSNNSRVLLNGKSAAVLGRICMNLTIIDLSKIKGAKVDDEVVLIGKQGKQEITAEELADKANTINYEIVTQINSKLKRIII